MQKKLPLLFVLAGLPLAVRAQVGIGTTTPDARAALELKATDKGLLIPRLTAAQRTALTGVPQGLLVYQTDGTASGGAQTGFWYYGGSGGWVFLDTSAGSGLTLPYSGTYGGAAATPAFDVSHTNGGFAIRGSAPNAGVGVYGSGSTGSGVYGTATGSGGYGVRGATTANNTAGVYGTATGGSNTYGVIGDAQTGVQGQGGGGPGLSGVSTSGPALLAAKAGGQTGRAAELTLAGTGNDSTAVYVSTVGARPALRAVNGNASAQAALRGVKTAGTNGIGVEGVVTTGGGNATGVLGRDLSNTSAGSGVIGLTTTGFGVQGKATGSNGWGVYGQATDSYGVRGDSDSGPGVYGTSSANDNSVAGVQGVGQGGNNAVGVLGLTTGGYGVRGEATASPGSGVYGKGTGTYGVFGSSDTGRGVYGVSTSSYGVQGYSTSSYGVYGATGAGNTGTAAGVIGSASSGGVGVLGTSTSGYGVRGEATSGYGIIGVATQSGGYGLFGSASGAATGITGQASGTGRAAYFNQGNSGSSSPAVVINQSGTGLALDVTGGAIRTPEVNSANTGTANLLPLAYGCIAANGTILSGSGNFSVSIPYAGTGYYEITLSAPAGTNLTNAVCVSAGTTADALSGQGIVLTTASGTTGGVVQVNTWLIASNGNPSQPNRAFSFVVYQP